ncbi:Hypothetical predicted protein [Cloeon dipterum]|uniref:Gustatory receptor n=1 Tax=Cloeon dipterum TaxID=197152 RepID=A0A8S1DKW8_9INSE|nr:Hypothetical predicted protein [Cloeon dipterum]
MLNSLLIRLEIEKIELQDVAKGEVLICALHVLVVSGAAIVEYTVFVNSWAIAWRMSLVYYSSFTLMHTNTMIAGFAKITELLFRKINEAIKSQSFQHRYGIHLLRDSFSQVCVCIELVSQEFFPLTYLCVPATFLIILINLDHSMVAYLRLERLYAQSKTNEITIYVSCGMWFLLLTFNLALLSSRCQAVRSELLKTRNLLYQAEMMAEEKHKNELSSFFHETLHYQKTSFNIVGVFLIDKSLLMLVFGPILTYLATLIQFQISTIHNAEGTKINENIKNNKGFQNDEILIFRRSYSQVCDCIELVSQDFFPLTFISVPATFIIILIDLDHSMVAFLGLERIYSQSKTKEIAIYSSCCMWILLLAFNLVLLSSRCQGARSELLNTRDLLYQAEMITEDDYKFEVSLFFHETLHYQQTNFNIVGVFLIDARLLMLVFGPLLTYLATLIQFQMSTLQSIEKL